MASIASLPGTDDVGESGLASSSSESAQEVMDSVQRKTVYFYVDTVFPLKLGIWDIRYALAEVEKETLLQRIRARIPKDTGHGFRVESVEARQKDGGAFVRCTYLPDTMAYQGQVDTSLSDISSKVVEAYAAAGERPWYSWKTSQAHLVRGKPWREDIVNRFPSSTLRVEFESGPELSQEQVFEIFRPYGRIRDLEPQSPASKDLPRFANVSFTATRSAAAARNCLYGYKYIPDDTSSSATGSAPGTVLRILYKERVRGGKAFGDWMTSHPRIVIPILAVLVGGLSYAIFDPIRAFFIKCKVSALFDLEKYRITKWLKRETVGRLGVNLQFSRRDGSSYGLGGDKEGLESGTGIENERIDAAEKLKAWLTDMPDTFVTITGPPGSGKQALVSSVTSHAKNIIYIDCSELVKQARGGGGGGSSESKLVSALATQLGYFPQFQWANSFSNLVDIASVGLIGTKAGFATNLDVQIKQVLDVAAAALKSLADEAKQARGQAAQLERARVEMLADSPGFVRNVRAGNIHDGRLDCLAGGGIMGELGMGLEPQPSETLDEDNLSKVLLPPLVSEVLPTISNQEAKSAIAETAPIAVPDAVPQEASKGSTGIEPETKADVPVPVAEVNSSRGIGTGPSVSTSDHAGSYSQIWGPASLQRARQATSKVDGDEAAGKSSTADIDNMPIVVIRGFEATHGKNFDVLWAGMADWAATLVENRIAHCIFVNDTVAVSRSLARALPSKPFSSITLTDATSENALAYVRKQLAAYGKEDLAQSAKVDSMSRLGGRLTDLETLIQKMRGGTDIDEAVNDIITRSSTEIVKNCFGDDADEAKSLAWSREQVWYLIKTLSKDKELSYPELLSGSSPFKDNEKAIRALEQAEVVTILHKEGHAATVRPGKPSYRAAFEVLAGNAVFAAQNELALNAKATAAAQAAIKSSSEDLAQLSQLFSKDNGKWLFGGSYTIPVEVAARVDECLKKMHKAQEDIVKLGEQAKELREALKTV